MDIKEKLTFWANNMPHNIMLDAVGEIERLQKVVDASAKAEREACAKLVEEHRGIYLNAHTSTDIAQKIAEAIRNRGTPVA